MLFSEGINLLWKDISKIIIIIYNLLSKRLMFNDTLITIWSAPNYCYRLGNVAAILELDENLQKFYKIFEHAPQGVRAK